VCGLACAAGLVAGCAVEAPAVHAAGSTVGGRPSPTVGRFAGTTTFQHGMLRLAPLPASYKPRVSAGEAYQAYLAAGVYEYARRYAVPHARLASFTDFGNGTPAADGSLNLAYRDAPEWVITFHDVPDGGSGPAALPSAPRPSRHVELHDVVVIVSAETGVEQMVLSDVPDVPPREPPSDLAPPG